MRLPYSELVAHERDLQHQRDELRERGDHMRVAARVESTTGDGDREIDFIASTEELDSHGTSLRGWDLARYLKNPVILFAHNGRSMPIGQATRIAVVGKRLMGTAKMLPAGVNQTADEVYEAAKGGALRGVSVGFYPREVEIEGDIVVLRDNELREISFVPVPSNPNTLIQQVRSAGGGEPRTLDVNPLLVAQDGEQAARSRASIEARMREERERPFVPTGRDENPLFKAERASSTSNPLRAVHYRRPV